MKSPWFPHDFPTISGATHALWSHMGRQGQRGAAQPTRTGESRGRSWGALKDLDMAPAEWNNWNLVGGLEHFGTWIWFVLYIGNVIIPTDFHILSLHHYSEGLVNHQSWMGLWLIISGFVFKGIWLIFPMGKAPGESIFLGNLVLIFGGPWSKSR